MNPQEDICIDNEELCAYIVEKTGFKEEQVAKILECEMEYLESLGLLEDKEPEEPEDHDVFVDTDELERYISERLNETKETIAAVLDAENSFLLERGVLGVKFETEC